MTRQREFDPESALVAAVGVFWRRGYEATSFDDLVEATGVSRYGLYTTLGNKREIYLKSLDHYADRLVGARLAPLERPGAGAKDVIYFFESFLEMAPKQAACGCLLTNAAVEHGPGDKAVGRRVERYIDRFEEVFAGALENSVKAGDFTEDVDCEVLARNLTASALGLFVMGRAKRAAPGGANTIAAIVSTIPIAGG